MYSKVLIYDANYINLIVDQYSNSTEIFTFPFGHQICTRELQIFIQHLNGESASLWCTTLNVHRVARRRVNLTFMILICNAGDASEYVHVMFLKTVRKQSGRSAERRFRI